MNRRNSHFLSHLLLLQRSLEVNLGVSPSGSRSLNRSHSLSFWDITRSCDEVLPHHKYRSINPYCTYTGSVNLIGMFDKVIMLSWRAMLISNFAFIWGSSTHGKASLACVASNCVVAIHLERDALSKHCCYKTSQTIRVRCFKCQEFEEVEIWNWVQESRLKKLGKRTQQMIQTQIDKFKR
jgi:hypothetical protein